MLPEEAQVSIFSAVRPSRPPERRRGLTGRQRGSARPAAPLRRHGRPAPPTRRHPAARSWTSTRTVPSTPSHTIARRDPSRRARSTSRWRHRRARRSSRSRAVAAEPGRGGADDDRVALGPATATVRPSAEVASSRSPAGPSVASPVVVSTRIEAGRLVGADHDRRPSPRARPAVPAMTGRPSAISKALRVVGSTSDQPRLGVQVAGQRREPAALRDPSSGSRTAPAPRRRRPRLLGLRPARSGSPAASSGSLVWSDPSVSRATRTPRGRRRPRRSPSGVATSRPSSACASAAHSASVAPLVGRRDQDGGPTRRPRRDSSGAGRPASAAATETATASERGRPRARVNGAWRTKCAIGGRDGAHVTSSRQ